MGVLVVMPVVFASAVPGRFQPVSVDFERHLSASGQVHLFASGQLSANYFLRALALLE